MIIKLISQFFIFMRVGVEETDLIPFISKHYIEPFQGLGSIHVLAWNNFLEYTRVKVK